MPGSAISLRSGTRSAIAAEMAADSKSGRPLMMAAGSLPSGWMRRSGSLPKMSGSLPMDSYSRPASRGVQRQRAERVGPSSKSLIFGIADLQHHGLDKLLHRSVVGIQANEVFAQEG